MLVVEEEDEEEGEDGGEAAAVPSTRKRILLCKLSPCLSSLTENCANATPGNSRNEVLCSARNKITQEIELRLEMMTS